MRYDVRSHAITFAPGGDTLLVEGNTFRGPVRSIPPAAGCTNVVVLDNRGLEDVRPRVSEPPHP